MKAIESDMDKVTETAMFTARFETKKHRELRKRIPGIVSQRKPMQYHSIRSLPNALYQLHILAAPATYLIISMDKLNR
ncbi:hypothetical protein D3C84_984860 [compost metagenome]